MKKFLFVLLALSCLLSSRLYAQYDLPENKVWIFGARNGIDFNKDPITHRDTAKSIPSAMCNRCSTTPGVSETIPGGASVCDTSGKLLFYTNGSVAWDRNNQRMPNANGLFPFIANTQVTLIADGGTIVGMPDSAGKYYVFSLTDGTEFSPYPGNSRLFYSVIDMKLNNGLGDVVPKRKWIPVDTGLSPKLVTVPGDNCNVWLIVHDVDTNRFKAYEITWKGINPKPVISYTGANPKDVSFYNEKFVWNYGAMVISPDRKKIAVGHASFGFAELYDFNPATGVVSNGWIVDSSGYPGEFRGVAFSPDNLKLYTTHPFPPGNSYVVVADIHQFDLSLGTHAAIKYSNTIVKRGTTLDELRLAGNGKIYFSHIDCCPVYIGTIDSPNVLGVGCDVKIGPMAGQPDYAGFMFGMGNDFVRAVPNLHPNTVATTSLDTCAQIDKIEGYVLQAPEGDYIDYTWDDNTTDKIRIVSKPGTYTVTSIDRCMNVRIDTFKINPPATFTLGNDTTVCTLPVTLRADNTELSYTWSKGTHADTLQAYNPGTYWATATNNYNCSYADSIEIKYLDLHQDLGKDRLVCQEDAIEIPLSANVPDDGRALWNTGSTTADIEAKDTGIYWVTVTALQCAGSDTLHIAGESCNCRFAAPTAFSPNGDGTNDLFHLVVERNCPVQSYSIVIYNRWGQKVYTGSSLETGWDGTSNGQPQDIGTYSYIVEFSVGVMSNHYFQKGEVTLIR